MTSFRGDAATSRQNFQRQGVFWFFLSQTVCYKLTGIVRQRATSLSATIREGERGREREGERREGEGGRKGGKIFMHAQIHGD